MSFVSAQTQLLKHGEEYMQYQFYSFTMEYNSVLVQIVSKNIIDFSLNSRAQSNHLKMPAGRDMGANSISPLVLTENLRYLAS